MGGCGLGVSAQFMAYFKFWAVSRFLLIGLTPTIAHGLPRRLFERSELSKYALHQVALPVRGNLSGCTLYLDWPFGLVWGRFSSQRLWSRLWERRQET